MERPARPASIAVALALAGCAHSPTPSCPPSPAAEAEIERAVHAMYDSFRTADSAAFRRITTPGFYTYDGGARYDGTALVDVLRQAQQEGTQFVWAPGRLHTQRRCDVAWAAWENVGSVGKPGAMKPVRWLESAVFVYRDGQWKIDFFHAHRAIDK